MILLVNKNAKKKCTYTIADDDGYGESVVAGLNGDDPVDVDVMFVIVEEGGNSVTAAGCG